MNFIKFLFSKSFLKHIFISVFLAILLFWVSLKCLKFYTNHGTSIEVPNVIGLQLIKAKTNLESFDLQIIVTDSSNFNPKYSPMAIIEQEPSPGFLVKKKRKIYVSLNPSDYKKIPFPDVIRKTVRQAVPTIESFGFKIGKLKYIDDIGKDEIIELRVKDKLISPGDLIKKTATIDIIIGNGR